MSRVFAKILPSSKTMRVLYIEDEPVLRIEARNLFSNFFESVDVAENGEQGLKKYKSDNYDIVITDIKMPRMDGLEMSKEIKKINAEQEIIIFSAMEDNEYSTIIEEMGIKGVIHKPLSVSEMIAALSFSIVSVESKKKES